jgi:hypothetical protein
MRTANSEVGCLSGSVRGYGRWGVRGFITVQFRYGQEQRKAPWRFAVGGYGDHNPPKSQWWKCYRGFLDKHSAIQIHTTPPILNF